jgi:uncharacterized damage-inducible protein DinB
MSAIVPKSTLALVYDYHYWMNAQMLAACEALTPEQWNRPLGHSWGNVHGLLAHMLAAEVIWLKRWQGESPRSLRQPEEFPTLEDLRRAWAELELEVRAFVAGCDDARLARDFSYTNTRGQAFSLPLGPVMLHVANHGTHHRGELVAMLAMLDVPHPEDDLLRYLQAAGGPAR